ncbi:MAG: DUF58 domain-containing protein [Firmicutes bacterium]|nr:DUF58 domain-containing protein [Bacillota bacterium]
MRKRRAIWIIWLLCAALLWLFENNAATLTLLIASVLLPLLSIMAAVRRSKNAQLSTQAKETELAVGVKGTGLFTCAAGKVFCENRLTGEQTQAELRFAPGLSGEIVRVLNVDTPHCGTLRLRPEVRVQDLFGLWQSEPLTCEEEYVTVEPKLSVLQTVLADNTAVQSDSEKYSQSKPGSDPSETFAIREYIPGDPIRQIHWKLSQKTDELMLRELGLPIATQILLIFRNLRMEKETVPAETANAMAETFLSVSHALVSEGLAHTAAFAEDGKFVLMSVENELDLHEMQEHFLTVGWEAESGELLRLLLETPSAHVVIVSAAVPPDAQSLSINGSLVTLLMPSEAEIPSILEI